MKKRGNRLVWQELEAGCGDARPRAWGRYWHRMKIRRWMSLRSVAWVSSVSLGSFLLFVGVAGSVQSVGAQQLERDQQKQGEAEDFPAASGTHPANGISTAVANKAVEGKKELADPNAYIIGEQDGLVITVWKEKELSGAVVVRPDGKITVPLVGEVKVVGMTPVELQTLLAEKLKPFVTVPQVTVGVSEIRSRKVYLIGHTAREGPFMINSSTTVLQIIAQAGGVRDFAKRKKIYILRQQGQEQVRIPFNYEDVIKGKHTEQNILLQPGDTIVVP